MTRSNRWVLGAAAGIAVMLAGCGGGKTCTSQSFTLGATQNVGFDYGTPGTGEWRDNRVRAYYYAGVEILTWIGFDSTDIPDGTRVTAVKLRLFHEVGFGNPSGNPQLVVWYSTGRNWTRAAVAKADLPATQAVSTAYATFVTNDWNEFAVDVAARDFAPDLVAKWLTLGVRNPVTTYSYVYFFGTDDPATRPQLVVTGDVCT